MAAMLQHTLSLRALGMYAAAGLLALTLAAPADAERSGPSDQAITAAIETELTWNNLISPHFIDVSTREGTVTLSGQVGTILEKEKAAELASTFKGVRAVINRLTVEPVDRTDQEVRADAVAALVLDPTTDSYEVSVKVDNGTVTVTGEVESYAEKDLVDAVVRNVKGVRDVVNKIAVTYETDRPEIEIKRDIQRRLDLDPYVADAPITVEVNGNTARLSGAVGTLHERWVAADMAFVAGVQKVDTDDLEVKWWALDTQQRREPVSRTDEELRDAVKDALIYDPRTWGYKIRVSVANGIATLRGTVDNLKSKRSAEFDAVNTPGIWMVDNRLRVRGEPAEDEELEDAIEMALGWDPVLERHEISVVVRNGKAYLYGDVDSYLERTRAEQIAEGVNGIAAVENVLDILNTEPAFTDGELARRIRTRYNWSPLVDADDIDVTTAHGTVTLTGTADTWTEYNAALDNAFDAGAATVISEVDIAGVPDMNAVYEYEVYLRSDEPISFF